AEAKDEARALLAEANRQIENTIRTIKEAQAEREKTREARSRLSSFAQHVATAGEADGAPLPGGEASAEAHGRAAQLHRKAEELRALQQRRSEKKPELGEAGREEENMPRRSYAAAQAGEVAVGCRGRIAGQSAVGTVAKINANGTVVLAVGSLYITTPIAKLELENGGVSM
ncbi:MAG: hypothetical protein LBH84_09485, partial [Prevotellaceae bacterium]|nr:hypothetical protein [Prevotellaceae bacterium]